MNSVEKNRNYLVVKSNVLALESRYQYSLVQQKTIAYICSKIQHIDNDKYQLEYKLEITEYLETLGIERSGNIYSLIKESFQSLSDRSMWIPINDRDGNGEVLVRWLSNVVIYKKSGKIKIKIDEYLAPYLFDLQKKYLSYGLINILNFKSKYSIRIYELLKAQYGAKGGLYYSDTKCIEWSVDIDDLKRLLMLDVEYVNFKDFRRCVLEISKREINKLSDILFEFEQIRHGRKTVAVCFKIFYKRPLDRLQSNAINKELLNRKGEK